jgi:YkoY family integral membrane protein
MLAVLTFLGQEFAWRDLIVVGLLVVLEGALSIDNALVLGLLAKPLPKKLQKRALTYGLVGAFAFRFIAVFMASQLLRWHVVKLLGGGYLLYIALKHLFFESQEDHGESGLTALNEPLMKQVMGDDESLSEDQRQEIAAAANASSSYDEADHVPGRQFWSTVAVIELTDIAFAVDSILAAIGVVGSPPPGHPEGAVHPKLWVVITGGLLGVILMRFAAVIFISLLEKFPRFSTAAYLLVLVIGSKLLVDWWFNAETHVVNFHDPRHAAFWIFWGLMLLSFATGFLPERQKKKAESD